VTALVLLVLRIVLACAFLAALTRPAWRLAGKLLGDEASTRAPFWRLLWAWGLALVGYLTFVNLVGRALENSTGVAGAYVALNVVATALIRRHTPAGPGWSSLARSWRTWIALPAVAIVVALPQLILAVSTNYFDEAASSAIHLTAANQFAEGVFPPRHNAFPDVVIKYHYAFTILSGTVRWLTGLSANVSVDVASMALWLFIFMFVVTWFRQLGFTRFVAFWSGWVTVLGGGLAWLYLPRIEAYTGVAKVPDQSELLHRWDPASSWWRNLAVDAQVPTLHLRNADGTLSNLPWDVLAQLQQHAVSVGMALTVFCFAVFVAWQRRTTGRRWPLAVVTIVSFGLLPLAHAAFGAMAAVAAGLQLVGVWLRRRTRAEFIDGVCFAAGVAALTLMHGGLFARGAQYGSDSVATLRHTLGYSAGGVAGFVNWNIAGFGIPLAFAVVAWALHRSNRDSAAPERRTVFALLTLFAVVSWSIPHLMYYASDTIGAEQFTEISKFFFTARLGFALVSAFGAAYVLRRMHWIVLAPVLPAMAVIPLAFAYAGSVRIDGSWLGFYFSPYQRGSVEQYMGQTLDSLKHGPRDTYFDASADERTHEYLGELLVFGGSVFTLTPSRYERTGVGYRIAESVTARRLVQNSRMARLEPRSAEDCACSWYYTRPATDMAVAPLVVRSRIDKLFTEKYFTLRASRGPRSLYEITKPTTDLDAGLERYVRPRVVTQPSRTGSAEIMFFDRMNNTIVSGERRLALPDVLKGGSAQVYVGHFAGAAGTSLLVGRLKDTYFKLGRRVEELVEWSPWGWHYHAAGASGWREEYELWLWDYDIPVVTDLENRGVDTHVAFRPRTGEWFVAPNSARIDGPNAKIADTPLPFGGRFLVGSNGDLGVWNLAKGTVTLKSVTTGARVEFRFGGRPGDVLVPGDYDGDGMDEIAVWQATNHTWYWRRAPDGPIFQATYGTATCVPVPADFNGDGKLDLAYWEPREGKIYISFNQGRSTARVITMPPGTVPAFVNMN
jgi:hypothetical protein